MNIYEHEFTVTCPKDDRVITYKIEITNHEIIYVESIISACHFHKAYHEDIADELVKRLPGKQIITATHSGVKVTTVR